MPGDALAREAFYIFQMTCDLNCTAEGICWDHIICHVIMRSENQSMDFCFQRPFFSPTMVLFIVNAWLPIPVTDMFVCLFVCLYYFIFLLVPASIVSGLVDWLMIIRVCFVSVLAIEFQCDSKPHLHSTSFHNVSEVPWVWREFCFEYNQGYNGVRWVGQELASESSFKEFVIGLIQVNYYFGNILACVFNSHS